MIHRLEYLMRYEALPIFVECVLEIHLKDPLLRLISLIRFLYIICLAQKFSTYNIIHHSRSIYTFTADLSFYNNHIEMLRFR